MMTTNALSIVFLNAAISWLFTTNTVEHWPQKLGGMEPNPYYAKWLEGKRGQNPYTLEYVAPEFPVYVNDTNADTMSIETSVNCQQLLSFEFDKRKFSETLTNEPWMHYSVEMQRVRTNDIVWLRAWEFGEHKELSVADFRGMLPAVKGGGLVYGFQYPTNYFVPVKTNELPLVSPVLVFYATNSIYPLSEGVTNFHWLWIATNTTNTTK